MAAVNELLNEELEQMKDLVVGHLENGLKYVICPGKVPRERFEAHLEVHVGEQRADSVLCAWEQASNYSLTMTSHQGVRAGDHGAATSYLLRKVMHQILAAWLAVHMAKHSAALDVAPPVGIRVPHHSL